MPDTAATLPGSHAYWETRYNGGGNSGSGSYNRLAHYKAAILNSFVQQNQITSVIEHGCGDGNQLSLAQYPAYAGFDVSPTVVAKCKTRFKDDATKRFDIADAYAGETADLALSLDVIYHLVEDEIFDAYMARLFASAEKFVIIYSSDTVAYNTYPTAPHVKHRAFSEWVKVMCPNWALVGHIPNLYPYTESDPHNTSLADFHFYKKQMFRHRTARTSSRRRRAAMEASAG